MHELISNLQNVSSAMRYSPWFQRNLHAATLEDDQKPNCRCRMIEVVHHLSARSNHNLHRLFSDDWCIYWQLDWVSEAWYTSQLQITYCFYNVSAAIAYKQVATTSIQVPRSHHSVNGSADLCAGMCSREWFHVKHKPVPGEFTVNPVTCQGDEAFICNAWCPHFSCEADVTDIFERHLNLS